MPNNFKKRVYTSLGLVFLLIAMFFNVFVLGYFLMIIGILSVLEFANITLRIPKISIYKGVIFNILFITYIFFVLSFFLILSFFSHLKILLFIILLACIFSDIGGYIFGKIFKGPKLTKISPNKTYAGMLGGFILSFIFGIIYLKNLTLFSLSDSDGEIGMQIIIIILSVSLISQIGDLIISLFKRLSKVKNTGKVIPGHGGLLDRIDGMIFAFPFSYLILNIYKI